MYFIAQQTTKKVKQQKLVFNLLLVYWNELDKKKPKHFGETLREYIYVAFNNITNKKWHKMPSK